LKKSILLLVCFVLLFTSTGCGQEEFQGKYKRIYFSRNFLSELVTCIDEDTEVIFEANVGAFPRYFSVYQIIPHIFTEKEISLIKEVFNEECSGTYMIYEDLRNEHFYIYDRREYGKNVPIDMSREAEFIERAKEIFNKLTFIDRSYTAIPQILSTYTCSGSDGEYTTNVDVWFMPKLDGIEVWGEGLCELQFNAETFEGFALNVFEYEKTGKIGLLSLDDAINQVKTPDDFYFKDNGSITGKVKTLKITGATLQYKNKYSNGCEILQPCYLFDGIATDENGNSAGFRATVIAIPEKYTYNYSLSKEDNPYKQAISTDDITNAMVNIYSSKKKELTLEQVKGLIDLFNEAEYIEDPILDVDPPTSFGIHIEFKDGTCINIYDYHYRSRDYSVEVRQGDDVLNWDRFFLSSKALDYYIYNIVYNE